jgi:hypothetical protein
MEGKSLLSCTLSGINEQSAILWDVPDYPGASAVRGGKWSHQHPGIFSDIQQMWDPITIIVHHFLDILESSTALAERKKSTWLRAFVPRRISAEFQCASAGWDFWDLHIGLTKCLQIPLLFLFLTVPQLVSHAYHHQRWLIKSCDVIHLGHTRSHYRICMKITVNQAWTLMNPSVNEENPASSAA